MKQSTVAPGLLASPHSVRCVSRNSAGTRVSTRASMTAGGVKSRFHIAGSYRSGAGRSPPRTSSLCWPGAGSCERSAQAFLAELRSAGRGSASCVPSGSVTGTMPPALRCGSSNSSDGRLDAREGQPALLADALELRRSGACFSSRATSGISVSRAHRALVVGGVLRVLQLGLAQRAGEDLPLPLGHHADEDAHAVARLEDVVDAPRALARRHRHRLLRRSPRAASCASTRARRSSRTAPLCTYWPRAGARRGSRSAARIAIAPNMPPIMSFTGAPARSGLPTGPGHVREAAHHLHHLVERGALLVGPGEEALHRAIDQARVRLRERLVAQALRLERAGTEVLDEHVGGGDQLLRLRRCPPARRGRASRSSCCG